MRLEIPIPERLESIFQPFRYKVYYGGRGAGKTWTLARALLAKSIEKKIRVGCFREIQNSIKESVHKVLSDQISKLKLDRAFTITDRAITSQTGSEFIFEGLFRNVNRIKSLEGIDIAWIEEAEKVTDESWDILIPTIRKDNSEIWISFNTQFEDDATYRRFVSNPPENSVVQQVNYYDNPWFPAVLQKEMEQDKARDFQKYENVWLGKPLGSGRKVWGNFDKDRQVKMIEMEEIAKRATCYMSMDPHSHYYPFCLWVAILPKNERKRWPEDFYKHVYAEWPTFEELGGFYHDYRHERQFNGTLADLAKEILAKDGIEYGIDIHSRFIDPRYAKGSGAWNWSTKTTGVVEEFAKRENGGLLFRCPDTKVLDIQRQIIHRDMTFNKLLAKSPYNEPSFSVSPECRNLIASLQNHRLEDGTEKESEKYKDPSDALRIAYAGFANSGYVDKNEVGIPEDFRAQFSRSLGIA